MQRWRRRIFYALVAYMAAMALWASRPWTDTELLVTPPDAPPAFAEYRCPSVFGSGPAEPVASGETPYVPAHRPCGEQGRHRALFVVDMAVSAAGVVVVRRSLRRHRADALEPDGPDPAPAGVVEQS